MNRIKEIRQEKKLSQKDLAKKLNISQQAISLYEKGDREPKLETWQKLAYFFGVSVPYLQGIEPDFKDVLLNTLNKNCVKNDLLNVSIKTYLKSIKADKLPLPFYELIYGLKEEEPTASEQKVINKSWVKFFDFLFNDKTLFLFEDSEQDHVHTIITKIRDTLMENGGTEISEYYYKETFPKIRAFIANMNVKGGAMFNSKADISKNISNVIDALNKFNNELDNLKENNPSIKDIH
ncbi:helix-turn-helix transcriptional regulator [Lactobacillus taiwanensis]|uniref:helix-turn-helix domain-containing protein n=1 Tax=Lactobacillus taiwanensis TaxID=508451 RepID=UPI00214B1E64|nr:helix-turn-helix transcriptional regulator [Lactobacillus taiwanensis]MCR1902664.1 helix-turn-helix transcriptional regulator [Lactobacillus taiwanensis]